MILSVDNWSRGRLRQQGMGCFRVELDGLEGDGELWHCPSSEQTAEACCGQCCGTPEGDRLECDWAELTGQQWRSRGAQTQRSPS